MRLYQLSVFACLSLLLMAVTPAFTIVPTVIVYPLASSPPLDHDTSAAIVTTLQNQIARGGNVKIIAASDGVTRENYLADARKQGANYYVTGFVTPIGSGASIVEQVVSATSGTLVFSVTNYITQLADVAAQGDQLRAGIIDRSTRGLQAFQAPPPPENTPTPKPSNGTEVGVNKLFSHKGAPAAAAVALAPPENARLAILAVGGSADFDQRTAAAKSIAGAIEQAGRHAVVVSADEPSSAVCSDNNATALVAAWLDTPPPNVAGANSNLRLIAYDCNGNVAFDRTFKQPLASVTGAAVTAYLNPPKRRA
ncbi:MAG TPA: hypothetical protein VGP41_09950 [Candidatus Lustribacter sp.]|nr:hypothetical protein [Candidatus Lustribacter sp.]